MTRRYAIAISWLLALSQPAVADALRRSEDIPPGQTKFRAFGAADGLRNLVIASIAQDAHGFLWLGTEDGVYRFDGERFTHFPEETYVVGIGPDGNACVGHRGLACWDGERFSRARTRAMPAVPIRTMVSH
ncbi:MAG TPA: two-component regulator propeller domain-containing protein, partial [Kofleriaceae bacterium]